VYYGWRRDFGGVGKVACNRGVYAWCASWVGGKFGQWVAIAHFAKHNVSVVVEAAHEFDPTDCNSTGHDSDQCQRFPILIHYFLWFEFLICIISVKTTK
jgi:hypothetical protein